MKAMVTETNLENAKKGKNHTVKWEYKTSQALDVNLSEEYKQCKNCGAEILGIEIVHLNTLMQFKVQFVLPGLIFERICICQHRERWKW